MKARLPQGMGGGPSNMQGMMKQVQKMQEQMTELQEDLDAREYDVLVAAVNEAIRKVEDVNTQEMQRVTGNVSIPGLF